MRTSFPNAKIFGCGFHFSQRLNMKWKNLGLVSESAKWTNMSKVLLRVRAMRFLPKNYVATVFAKLQEHARSKYPGIAQIHEFFAYVETTWVTSTIFPVSSWCQYKLPVRTNNRTEGYHRSFNEIVGARPPLYRFMEALHSCVISNRDRLAKEDFDSRRSTKLSQKEEKVLNATDAWVAVRAPWKEVTTVLDYISKVFGFKPED